MNEIQGVKVHEILQAFQNPNKALRFKMKVLHLEGKNDCWRIFQAQISSS